MKTQGFEQRFSQNLAPVGARKATKTLPCLHFTFIQPTLFIISYLTQEKLNSVQRGAIAPLLESFKVKF